MKRGFLVVVFILLLLQTIYASNNSLYIELTDETNVSNNDSLVEGLAEQISDSYNVSYDDAVDIVVGDVSESDVLESNFVVLNESNNFTDILPQVNRTTTNEYTISQENTTASVIDEFTNSVNVSEENLNNSDISQDNSMSDNVVEDTLEDSSFFIEVSDNTSVIDSNESLYVTLEEFVESEAIIVEFDAIKQSPIYYGDAAIFTQDVQINGNIDSFIFDLQSELIQSYDKSVFDESTSTVLYHNGAFVSSGDVWVLNVSSDNSDFTLYYLLPSPEVDVKCEDVTIADTLPDDAVILESSIDVNTALGKSCTIIVSQPTQIEYADVTVSLNDLFDEEVTSIYSVSNEEYLPLDTIIEIR